MSILDSYTPINYSKWDFSGLGANICPNPSEKLTDLAKHPFPVLRGIERRIWREAIPFQDMRDDEGQGEFVTLFALKLLRYAPGEMAIAVPAAILHDTGFSKMPKAGDVHRAAAKAGTVENVDYRKVHQDFGVEIAREILGRLNYASSHIEQICDIIGDHDTRLKPATESGMIMRDADILWRFTVPSYLLYQNLHHEFGEGASGLLQHWEKKELSKGADKTHTSSRFYTPTALQIARVELANTLMHVYPNEAPAVLKQNYSAELEKLSK